MYNYAFFLKKQCKGNEIKMKQICFIINKTVFFYCELNKIVYLEDGKEKIINLNAPASRCLMLLIDKRNTVVHRDEFIHKVWRENGIVVANNTYYQNISILRKYLCLSGLSDDSIVTIPKKGLILNKNICIEKVFTEKNFFHIHEKKSNIESSIIGNDAFDFNVDSNETLSKKINKAICSFLNFKIKLYYVLLFFPILYYSIFWMLK